MPGTTLLVTLGRIWHLLEVSCTQCSTSDQQLEQENIGFITPRVDFTTQVSNLLTACGLSRYCPSSTQPHPGGLPKHRSDFAAALHKMSLWSPLALKRKSSSLASCSGLSLRYLQPLPFLFLGILCPHQFWSDLLGLLFPSPQGFWLSLYLRICHSLHVECFPNPLPPSSLHFLSFEILHTLQSVSPGVVFLWHDLRSC